MFRNDWVSFLLNPQAAVVPAAGERSQHGATCRSRPCSWPGVRGDLETNCRENISFNQGYFYIEIYMLSSYIKARIIFQFFSSCRLISSSKARWVFFGKFEKKLSFWCSFHWRPVKHPHDFATFHCCCCVSGWIDASFAVCLFRSVHNAQETNGANRFCELKRPKLSPRVLGK